MENVGDGMQMQGQIFQDMVVQEAIKDKTAQVEAEMNDRANNGNADLQMDKGHQEHDDFEDEDFLGMDDEEERIMEQIREARIQDIKYKNNEDAENRIKGHGEYREITEQEFLPMVTKSQYCVVHFYHNDFERCKIIDMHLRNIACKHTEAKFANLNAEKSPFFIQKLNVQMLPTVIMFNDGVAVDRICGFDDLGGVDDFPEIILTRRLIFGGVLAPLNDKEEGRMKVSKRSAIENEVEDDY